MIVSSGLGYRFALWSIWAHKGITGPSTCYPRISHSSRQLCAALKMQLQCHRCSEAQLSSQAACAAPCWLTPKSHSALLYAGLSHLQHGAQTQHQVLSRAAVPHHHRYPNGHWKGEQGSPLASLPALLCWEIQLPDLKILPRPTFVQFEERT